MIRRLFILAAAAFGVWFLVVAALAAGGVIADALEEETRAEMDRARMVLGEFA